MVNDKTSMESNKTTSNSATKAESREEELVLEVWDACAENTTMSQMEISLPRGNQTTSVAGQQPDTRRFETA
ncbi:hypothetical protein AU504_15175 [Lonsdalea populi]|nr:hypothetical protein AU508_11530 [Lonsdalea populi]RAT66840.1 hypothetical protein AU504_15175 [Lonsdalea populi]RAT70248.1 hypothetical protein AU505_11900 [Lonsdalea populi]RAT76842.1 hypothetical protein AU506_04170 [Lonsdalea populi]RAT79957.1 hypothetical protein AU507_00860 [Lonsdalea populi]